MRLLLVDDEERSRNHIAEFLKRLGHSVVEAGSGVEALNVFAGDVFNLILSDIRMPGMSGLELLHEIRRRPDGLDVDFIIFTAYADMETVIEAMRYGASDYLLKPLQLTELVMTLERLDKKRRTRLLGTFETAELDLKRENKVEICSGPEMGVFSEKMHQTMYLAERMHADRTVPVLVEGETGTGKELLARYIHYGPEQSSRPFVAINCAALTSSIFESELFGYEGGAFSGALPRGQRGKMDLANGGTLFLDEIAELAPYLQAKLLRVIQEKEYYRVGGLKQIQTDIRIICATNQNLDDLVEQGLFRADLFYRLNVGRLYLPPLRERREDILPLALMFLNSLAEQKQKKCKSISNAAIAILLHYSWPGNVRELKNLMEWITLRYDDEELLPCHLHMLTKTAGAEKRTPGSGTNQPEVDPNASNMSLADLSNAIIVEALKMHNGNKTETAKYLGISRSSLYYRLKHM